MSSAEDSPAKTSVPPEKEQESQESGRDCGPSSPGSLARFNRHTSSWKTAQCSLFGGLELFSGTWPRWGLMRAGELFPLQMPSGLEELRASITSGSGFGLRLLTPTKEDHKSDGKKAMEAWENALVMGALPKTTYQRLRNQIHFQRLPPLHGMSKDGKSNGPSGNELGCAVNRMQTPVADDAVGRTKGKFNSRGEPKLSAQVLIAVIEPQTTERERVPTPTVNDSKNDGPPSQFNRNSMPLNCVVKRKPTVTKSDAMGGPGRGKNKEGANNLRTDIGGSLNPPWVEWLMGWPIGWTELRPLEMDKFRQWRRSHGGF